MIGPGGELAAVLADAALKATVVLVLALALERALRRSSAAVRHLVWAVAVFGILAIPVASVGLPSLEAGLWPSVAPGAEERARHGAEEMEERLLREGSLVPDREEIEALRSGDLTALPVAEGASSGRASSRGGLSGETARPEIEERAGPEGKTPGATASDDAASTLLTPPPTNRTSGSWGAVATVVWALGAGLVLLTLAGERVLLLVSARRSGTFGPGRVRERARSVARRMGLRRMPDLARLEDGAMPATWGVTRHTVGLPGRAVSWSDERLESVLAHEMAHVRRRDCAVQTAAVVACALYWFHPLAWVAAARLRRERELAADDEVLALGARPSSYARELLTLAASTERPRLAVTATAMAAEVGLPRRIRSVISAEGRRRTVSGSLAARAAAVGALVLLPLSALAPAPESGAGGPDIDETVRAGGWEVRSTERRTATSDGVYPGPEECWRPGVSHSMRVHAHGSRHELEWESDGCESEILVDGHVSFTADFSGIRDLSAGGVVKIEEKTDEYRRSVEYRPGPEGAVERTFRREGRVTEPTDREARWIRERLITVLRQTGIAAGERVAWILERSGPDGVLDELEWIAADGAAGRYMTELLERAGLDRAQLRRFLEVAAGGIGSDGVLSRVLVRTVEEYPGPVAGAVRDAFRNAAGTIGSDGSMGALVEAMAVRPDDGGVELARLALELAAEGIGSDGQMSRFLRRTVERHPKAVAGPLRDGYRDAAATVGSDGSLGTVVRAMTAAGEGSERSGLAVLALELAAESIGSDGEMAGLLREVVRRGPATVTGPGREAFLAASRTVGSDGSLGSVVEAMVEPDAAPEMVALALETARTIGSDGQMAGFLVRVVERHPRLVRTGEALAGPFERALGTVSSDGEELRVRRALERARSAGGGR